ncbi:hypothetical protein LCGC14_1531510, partial [marine sediment metagenome]
MGVRLDEELAELERVWQAGACPGVVFYSARIMEAMLREVLRGEDHGGQVFEWLKVLEERGQLSHVQRMFAHNLRILGNDARHLRRQLGPEDAEVAIAMLERLLVWFCREMRQHPWTGVLQNADRDVGRSVNGVCPSRPTPEPRLAGVSEGLRTVFRLLDQPDAKDVDIDRVLKYLQQEAPQLSKKTPIIDALCADALIAAGRCGDALKPLREAQRRFGRDVRLRQLEGLALRRLGR